MPAFLKSLPLSALLVAVLASVGAMAVFGPLNGQNAYAIVLFILGSTAVAGTAILVSSDPNSNLIPHLIVLIAIIGFTTALGVEKVFTATQVEGVFAAMLGGGSLAAGVNAVTPSVAASVAKKPLGKQPPPPSAPGTVPDLLQGR